MYVIQNSQEFKDKWQTYVKTYEHWQNCLMFTLIKSVSGSSCWIMILEREI